MLICTVTVCIDVYCNVHVIIFIQCPLICIKVDIDQLDLCIHGDIMMRYYGYTL